MVLEKLGVLMQTMKFTATNSLHCMQTYKQLLERHPKCKNLQLQKSSEKMGGNVCDTGLEKHS